MATDSLLREPLPQRSDTDELVNTATHGIGIFLSLIGTVALHLTTRSGNIWMQVAVMAYAVSLTAVYTLSTLSHAVKSDDSKRRIRAWDQGTIYFLIVGTYTPFAVAYLPAKQATTVVTVMWLAAGIGFWSKVIVKHRVNTLSTWSYIALGWLPALTMIGRVPIECVMWMAIGGVSYTVGVVFLKLDQRISYFHGVWHVLVIVASACHYYAIMAFVAT